MKKKAHHKFSQEEEVQGGKDSHMHKKMHHKDGKKHHDGKMAHHKKNK